MVVWTKITEIKYLANANYEVYFNYRGEQGKSIITPLVTKYLQKRFKQFKFFEVGQEIFVTKVLKSYDVDKPIYKTYKVLNFKSIDISKGGK